MATTVTNGKSYTDFLSAIRDRESTQNYQLVSSKGYLGAYQFAEVTLKDLDYYTDSTSAQDWIGTFTGKNGVTSKSQLLNTPSLQDKVFGDMLQLYWGYAQQSNFHMTDHLGETIVGIDITPSVIVAGSHLAGIGKMRDFLDTKGAGYAADSGLVKYLTGLSGFDLPFVASVPEPTPVPVPTTPAPGGTVNGTDKAETLTGTAGEDLLKGLGGNDILLGGAAADTLYGGTGSDVLKGEAGSDSLWGDSGKDTLWGGSDADFFRFKSAGYADGDTIMDFQRGDKIDFSLMDANASKSGNQAFVFDGIKVVGQAGHVNYREDAKAGVTHVHGDTGSAQFDLVLKGVKLGLIASDFML